LADYLTIRVLDQLLASQNVSIPLRILDPSCGGGIFLLAALRYFLQRHGKPSPQETLDLVGGSLFGSDIDTEAIVATRHTLLLAAWDALRASGNETLDGGLRVLADGVTQAARCRVLEDIERQVAELYGIDPAELSASEPSHQGDGHARPS